VREPFLKRSAPLSFTRDGTFLGRGHNRRATTTILEWTATSK
jgi:hypothetical protein